MKEKKKYIYDEDGDKLIEDVGVDLNDKPRYVEDDIIVSNPEVIVCKGEKGQSNKQSIDEGKHGQETHNPSLTFSADNKAKLELLRELNKFVIELGRTQLTKTMIYDWIDKEKEKINKET